jgi:hypothetical protein
MATAMTDDFSASTDTAFDLDPSQGEVKSPSRSLAGIVLVSGLVLIFALFSVVALIRLQISAYHEAEEKKMHDAAELLERSATRLEKLPGPGNRWGIMAADQRRDAQKMRENAERHSRLKQSYSASAWHPWTRVSPDRHPE